MTQELPDERILRVAQMLAEEHRDVISKMLEAHRHETDLKGHLVTVSAGTVALVVPMLAGKSIVKSEWWLFAAAVTLIVNIAVAVLIAGVARWIVALGMRRVGKHYQEGFAFLGDGDIDGFKKHHDSFIGGETKRLPKMLTLVGLSDVLFFGTLLVGLGCLVRSLF
jgi:hypothetical protein